MSGLTFTEDTARKLERLYLTTDVVAQRSETMEQLALSKAWRSLLAVVALLPAWIFRAT